MVISDTVITEIANPSFRFDLIPFFKITLRRSLSLSLQANLTQVAPIDSSLDWSANYAHMMGYTDPQFLELMRLYLTIHRYS